MGQRREHMAPYKDNKTKFIKVQYIPMEGGASREHMFLVWDFYPLGTRGTDWWRGMRLKYLLKYSMVQYVHIVPESFISTKRKTWLQPFT